VPIILATQKAGSRPAGQIVHETSISKNNQSKMGYRMAQVVELLLCNCGALNPNPSPTKKKKKKKQIHIVGVQESKVDQI
jgi:hypothetical protein